MANLDGLSFNIPETKLSIATWNYMIKHLSYKLWGMIPITSMAHCSKGSPSLQEIIDLGLLILLVLFLHVIQWKKISLISDKILGHHILSFINKYKFYA